MHSILSYNHIEDFLNRKEIIQAMEIEKELKTLLSFDEYQKLFNYFNCQRKDPVLQENHYYDTKEHWLKVNQAGFRLRNFNDSSEWTLKIQQTDNISLEYTQINSQIIPAPTEMQTAYITDKEIIKYFKDKQVSLNSLKKTYQILTYRYKIKVDQGEFCLDRSVFGKIEDYELEFEYQTDKDKALWFDILKKNHIIYRSAPKKIARAAQYQNIHFQSFNSAHH